ncbi:hypothetical protein DUI87_26983 [Hirundo rustica rustica]|uniref:Cadherin domain-containing protein n=1 Tax=Hirundo rustica rustica TaxID=333673 RepID=A0A3M0J7U0_HIRRU|nr:hypothetical protein DUI87_26983 [Hirundo rustica rustica]
MCAAGRRWGRRQRALLWAVLLAAWEAAWGQLRYSVPEEMPKGSFVGDVANDLGLQLPALIERDAHVFDTEHEFYELVVQARDAGGLSSHSKSGSRRYTAGDSNSNFSVQDRDSGANGEVQCSISDSLPFRLEKSFDDYYRVVTARELDREQVSEYKAETGALYALRSLDYEQVRELQLWVVAEDGGAPALSGNASVRLLIADENDNAPRVLYPPAGAGSGGAWSGVELAPRGSEPGALVAKVVAVDADAGQNAWLSYELAKATEPGLFRVGLHSGEVRTARLPLARDAARHSLVVVVKDHGRPALSATATLSVLLADSVAELLAELGGAAEAAAPGEPAGGLTRWLVLAVAAVSCLFLAFLLLLLALRLRRWRRRQLLPPAAAAAALRGVPVSHFVGIDGVRAFLHSYSHDVSLTADSRKSHLRFSRDSCCDTLQARPPDEASGDLVPSGEEVAESGGKLPFRYVNV